jgi:DNA-binding LacI/PurR family transcriptional regulator
MWGAITVKISSDNPLPAYYQLTEILLADIRDNFKPGDLYYSQNALMAEYSVSYATVARALDELRSRGMIYRQHGKGTFVASAAPGAAAPRAAQPTSSHPTGNVGMLVPEWRASFDATPFFKEMLGELTTAAADLDYHVVCLSTDLGRPAKLKHFLRGKGVDGLVVFNPFGLPPKALDLIRATFPVVISEKPTSASMRVSWVDVDNARGMRLGMLHLLESGHERIALLNGDATKHPVYKTRLDAYKTCLKEARRPFRQELVAGAKKFTTASAAAAMKGLLRGNPDAVFSTNGTLTMGAVEAIHSAKLSVGTDISVVGYDDDTAFALMTPSITTIRQPIAAFARELVGSLVAEIQNPSAERGGRLLEPALVARDSVVKRAALRKATHNQQ